MPAAHFTLAAMSERNHRCRQTAQTLAREERQPRADVGQRRAHLRPDPQRRRRHERRRRPPRPGDPVRLLLARLPSGTGSRREDQRRDAIGMARRIAQCHEPSKGHAADHRPLQRRRHRARPRAAGCSSRTRARGAACGPSRCRRSRCRKSSGTSAPARSAPASPIPIAPAGPGRRRPAVRFLDRTSVSRGLRPRILHAARRTPAPTPESRCARWLARLRLTRVFRPRRHLNSAAVSRSSACGRSAPASCARRTG